MIQACKSTYQELSKWITDKTVSDENQSLFRCLFCCILIRFVGCRELVNGGQCVIQRLIVAIRTQNASKQQLLQTAAGTHFYT